MHSQKSMLHRMYLKKQLNITVEWVDKAIELWGNYGPLEIWIVGEGKDEVIALDKKWCEVRTAKRSYME